MQSSVTLRQNLTQLLQHSGIPQVWLLAFLFISCSSFAQDDAPESGDIIPSIEQEAEINEATGLGEEEAAVTGEPAAESEANLSVYESPIDPVDTYLDAIEDAEVMNGAYSMDLADLYLGLGNSLLSKQEYDDAKEAFQQGMQIVRVNFGLNSPEQISYLFAVADIESILGNRRLATKVLNDIYAINSRNFGRKAPEMLPVLSQILTWYQANRPADSPVNTYEDLERSGLITGEMAEIIELDKGLGHPDTTGIYRRQGQLHWHTAKYVLGRGISVEPGVIMATGKPSYSPRVKEVSIKSHFREGRTAFAKVAESVGLHETSTAMEHAESIAQLGDWNLAFGKKQAAGTEYQRAYRLLAERLRSEQIANEYFKDPVPVRFMNEKLMAINSDPESEAAIILKASMTITEGGRALNIEILDPPENIPHGKIRSIGREISSMHFRPRLLEGVPKKVTDFIFHFPVGAALEES